MVIEFAHQAYKIDLIDFDLTNFVIIKSTSAKAYICSLPSENVYLVNGVYKRFIIYLIPKAKHQLFHTGSLGIYASETHYLTFSALIGSLYRGQNLKCLSKTEIPTFSSTPLEKSLTPTFSFVKLESLKF